MAYVIKGVVTMSLTQDRNWPRERPEDTYMEWNP